MTELSKKKFIGPPKFILALLLIEIKRKRKTKKPIIGAVKSASGLFCQIKTNRKEDKTNKS